MSVYACGGEGKSEPLMYIEPLVYAESIGECIARRLASPSLQPAMPTVLCYILYELGFKC